MKPLMPCGTRAAYKRHLRRREVPCNACTQANREASAGLPAQRRADLDMALASGRRVS